MIATVQLEEMTQAASTNQPTNPHMYTLPDTEPMENLCGTRIRVASGSDRTATIGGTVIIDGVYYALTALNPFIQDIRITPDGDRRRYRVDFRSDTMYRYATDGDDNHAVGYLPEYQDTGMLDPIYWSLEQDWALFRLCDQSPKCNRLQIGGWLMLSPSKVSKTSPRGTLWCLLGSSPRHPVRTDAFRLGYHLTAAYQYHLSMVSFPKDIGAWVVDAGAHGALYCMVVGQDDSDMTTYAVSAADIFRELHKRFPASPISIA
ncbi:uncharacterized protein BP01DRAFT_388496 [Aspergillus saccharolyticus JOP 1030-1]|uniref:Uncharacterized protein n=1 Tax=Aspergillus saccharolyticus JOP 1030-1 TaxID=1450539 RepID=A0A319ATC2_9EURO|nr:hypothetical protein BP01DRAFT_388496 [Aspergillus saccharolyticus JOP 1030-1]PYH49462.1 hypothetical protein BP01DRAFT_388496 [Aspergillus saccharolyticus JOP 1030-1]